METELITRYLGASLALLFEDLDNEVLIRWTSVTDDKVAFDERPAGIVSTIDGASSIRTVAYGEVKPDMQAINHCLVNMDLECLGRPAKGAIDANGTTLAFAFLVVGNHSTFYLVRRQQSMYTMLEVGHVQLPVSIREIPLYLAQPDTITDVIVALDKAIASFTHGFAEHPKTLRSNQVRLVDLTAGL